ncbi:MAG: addiction module protein [Campylobacterota bacterium]|nr:addiction module protein [Campylobacterota bacterium]
MMQVAIEEPKIEQFFNHSKDEIIKALKFIVDNNIKDFGTNQNNLELSTEQKEELNSRISSFHNDPSIGVSWNEVKSDISR